MKIKRFFAQDSRTAIRQVKETLGSDAVILSNRTTQGGIEIVAAIDYNEELVRDSIGLPEPNDSLAKSGHSADANQPGKSNRVEVAGKEPAAPKIVWSQEPVMREMQRDLENMKGLLHNQMSGLVWQDKSRNNPLNAELLKRLMELGLHPELGHVIAEALSKEMDPDQAWRSALGLLARQLPVKGDRILDKGGCVALVGPTGVGKTTTIAKLAARFILRHGKQQVALITMDNYRVGGHEQLANYARILNIPITAVRNAEELQMAINSFADRRLVLIDTAGVGHRDLRLPEQFAMLHEGGVEIDSYLVLSAATQQFGLNEIVKAYKGARLKGCLFTKLDEAASLGGVISAAIKNRLPIAYVSDGQRVPEDLHLARANNCINRAVTLMQKTSQKVDNSAMALTFGGMAINAYF